MSMRDVRLVQGVIFRTYFIQFAAAAAGVADDREAEEDCKNKKVI